MNLIRKASLGVVGLAVALGGLTMVGAVAADAAAPCAAENQAAGAARNEAGHKSADVKRANKKLKKAKKAYKKHHTKANKKKVKKARKAKKRAVARSRAANARYASAAAAANRCRPPATSPARPATSRDAVTSITDTLVKLGVPQVAIDQLQPALAPLGKALAGTPLNQLQPVVDEVATALANGADPSALTSVIKQITDPLTQAGIPADKVAQALEQGLAQIPTDPSQIPSDPTTLVNTIVGGVENALVGTPLDQLNPALEQVRTGLDSTLGTLLGTLTGGLPGLTLPGL